jgi:hypothetical protein
MNKFGVQYLNEALEKELRKKVCISDLRAENKEIRKTLKKFQQGYTKRNLEEIDSFMKKIFIDSHETSILGTGTGELALGIDEVRNLIEDDWKYWGDINIDCENANISRFEDVAWVSTKGSVKYIFEDTLERYDNYLSFIKDKVHDDTLTPKQKVTYINWILALTYHQRLQGKREYLWPLGLSGVLLRDKDRWKFKHIKFSIPRANFPDERFENSKQYTDSYNEQNNKANEYKYNQITPQIKKLLKSFQVDILGIEDITKEMIEKYFVKSKIPYIIGPENQWYYGIDQINEFFNKSDKFNVNLDIEHSIASTSGEITWQENIKMGPYHITMQTLMGLSIIVILFI